MKTHHEQANNPLLPMAPPTVAVGTQGAPRTLESPPGPAQVARDGSDPGAKCVKRQEQESPSNTDDESSSGLTDVRIDALPKAHSFELQHWCHILPGMHSVVVGTSQQLIQGVVVLQKDATVSPNVEVEEPEVEVSGLRFRLLRLEGLDRGNTRSRPVELGHGLALKWRGDEGREGGLHSSARLGGRYDVRRGRSRMFCGTVNIQTRISIQHLVPDRSPASTSTVSLAFRWKHIFETGSQTTRSIGGGTMSSYNGGSPIGGSPGGLYMLEVSVKVRFIVTNAARTSWLVWTLVPL